MGYWEEEHRGEGPFLSHNIKSTYLQHDMTVDVDLSHLAKVVLIQLPTDFDARETRGDGEKNFGPTGDHPFGSLFRRK